MSRAKHIATFIFAGGLLFSSCGTDDGFSASLIGKWNKTSTTTTTNNGTPQTTNYQGNEIGCDKDYLEFSGDGVLRDVELFKNQDEICTEDVNTSEFERTGDVFTTVSQAGTETYTITKLSGSELRFESTGVIGGVSITVSQYFRKK